MAVTLKGQTAVYEGTSTDTKPTDADNNAIFKELDTGIRYYYDGTDWNEIPSSGGGGGGTGTDNYNDLNNKPSINGTTLSGNKSLDNLGIQAKLTFDSAPTEDSENPVTSGGVYTALATNIQGIKVNGSTVNPDSNKVVNITVPTSAADVSALPDTTKYAAALKLTINSSTFVMTGQLKDQDGNNLGTAQTIDLPLESVVVGGSYDSQTKKVVLTLQNGNTIEFSVADLVSGLQTELSASNKLNPAYINYDSTHRAVSDTEKSEWNSKQDAIDSSHKLSADFVDDTGATNKFATEEELEQIETNKNNIVFVSQNGVANYAKVGTNSYANHGLTVTVSNGEVTISGTTNSTFSLYISGKITDDKENDNKLTSKLPDVIAFTGAPNSDDNNRIIFSLYNGSTWVYSGSTNDLYHDLTDKVYTHWLLYIPIISGNQYNGVWKPMIVPKTLYDSGFTNYQPYALSNAELTAKEQTNETNISYNTDNGVKNTFDFANAPEEAKYYTTVFKTATSLTVTANNPNAGSSSVVYSGKDYPAGDYIFSCKITDYSCTTETARIYIATSTAAGTDVANKTITGNGTIQIPFHWNGGKVYIKYFPNESNTANQSNTFTASENMIMLASISDTTYQPYAMSNAELTAAIQALQAQLANQ